MGDDFLVQLDGLLAHGVFTITPKKGVFGEHYDVVLALTQGINNSNLRQIVSVMGVEKFKTHFDFHGSDGNKIDFDKLSELVQEYEITRIRVLAGQR